MLNILKRKKENSCVLVISDLHSPYHHPDALKFLSALKDKYNPDKVICMGDELDFSQVSYHESNPNMDSAKTELEKGRKFLYKLEKLFPEMDVMKSNHGSLPYRKAVTAGLPLEVIKHYRDIIFNKGGGEGWHWHNELVLTLSNGKKCKFKHIAAANVVNSAAAIGMNLVSAHRHTSFKIQYVESPDNVRFGMCVGCLIDDTNPAFDYNDNTDKRPVTGCAVIENGIPKLIPMVLKKNNKWDGVV